MSTILIKDSLRQSVEAATNGEQTVLYTAKGQPTFMNVIKKFNMSTIDASLSGTHPAFIVNSVEKDAIFVGAYEGVLKNGELLSLPNQSPSHTQLLATLDAAVKANGAGHHLITNAEWSAIALQSYKAGTLPKGNTYYGRSADDATQLGRRVDGLDAAAGITTGLPMTLNGSGPVSWRHNGKYNGIADLAGNLNEFTLGVRLVNGEIQIIAGNDVAAATTDYSASSNAWKAIDGRSGDLITPDGNGTTQYSVKFATSGAADYTLVTAHWGTFGKITNPSTTAPVAAAALTKLKALCLFPLFDSSTAFGLSVIGLNTSGEMFLQRGGTYTNSNAAGIFYLGLNFGRSTIGPTIASRPCYYTP